MSDLIDEYLRRIGLNGQPPCNAEGLIALHRAHRLAIPFENLDIPLGRPIRIDSESVFAKLVRARRGGYCFEQNRLFSDLLAAMGFANRPLLARVRLMAPDDSSPPRTHVLQLVDLDGERWIADAGFGGSLTPPMPLVDGASAETGEGARHRLRCLGGAGMLSGEWLLERAGPPAATDGRAAPHEDWQAQYTFELAEVATDDLEMGNHWTSTRPDTRFTTLHIASMPLADGFVSLNEKSLTFYRSGEPNTREIDDPGEYAEVLRSVFGLDLSEAEVATLPLFTAPTSP